MGEGEMKLLFADDIVYLKSYRYKNKGKIDKECKIKAKDFVQSYLNKLEDWMGDWRLSLAPKKCSQITFSKSRDSTNDKMEVTLYGEEIKQEIHPKFLGITFDTKLKFSAHLQSIKKKLAIEHVS